MCISYLFFNISANSIIRVLISVTTLLSINSLCLGALGLTSLHLFPFVSDVHHPLFIYNSFFFNKLRTGCLEYLIIKCIIRWQNINELCLESFPIHSVSFLFFNSMHLLFFLPKSIGTSELSSLHLYNDGERP